MNCPVCKKTISVLIKKCPTCGMEYPNAELFINQYAYNVWDVRRITTGERYEKDSLKYKDYHQTKEKQIYTASKTIEKKQRSKTNNLQSQKSFGREATISLICAIVFFVLVFSFFPMVLSEPMNYLLIVSASFPLPTISLILGITAKKHGYVGNKVGIAIAIVVYTLIVSLGTVFVLL